MSSWFGEVQLYSYGFKAWGLGCREVKLQQGSVLEQNWDYGKLS